MGSSSVLAGRGDLYAPASHIGAPLFFPCVGLGSDGPDFQFLCLFNGFGMPFASCFSFWLHRSPTSSLYTL